MALKRLKTKTVTPPSKPGEAPTINIDGDIIKQYVEAAKQMKRAEEVLSDLRPEVLEVGHSEIYRRSIENPITPVTTVRLKDETEEELMVIFTSRYKEVADIDGLESLFEVLRQNGQEVDENDYVQEKMQITFDSSALCEPDGKFSQVKYDKFRKAIEKVAADLDMACPIETKKVVTPLPKFHQARWMVFPDFDTQKKLSDVCPNVTQIKTELRPLKK